MTKLGALSVDIKVNRSPLFRVRVRVACALVSLANWLMPSFRIILNGEQIGSLTPSASISVDAKPGEAVAA